MTENELPDYTLSDQDADDIVGTLEDTEPVDVEDYDDPDDPSWVNDPVHHPHVAEGDMDGVEITQDDTPGEAS